MRLRAFESAFALALVTSNLLGGTHSWTSGTGLEACSPNPSTGCTVTAIAIDPSDSRTVYAATFAGIFKSGDGGEHWHILNNLQTVWSLTIDPTDGNVLYATTGTGEVWKSVNAGQFWTLVKEPTEQVGAIVVDPATPSNLYASSSGLALVASFDGGASWSHVHTSGAAFYALPIRFDAQLPGTLLVAAKSSPDNTLIYRVSNWGTTWTLLSSVSAGMQAIAVGPGGGAPIYLVVDCLVLGPGQCALFLKSTDGGFTWTTPSTSSWPLSRVYLLAAHPQIPGHLYLGTQDGLFRSLDDGANWSSFDDGIPRFPLQDYQVTDFVIDRSGTRYYRSNSFQVFDYEARPGSRVVAPRQPR